MRYFSCSLVYISMPKLGLPASEWRRRLRAYADRRFVFSRGQHPPKNSTWNRELKNIDRCPKQATRSRFDLFGAPVPCRCGYHVGSTTEVNFVSLLKFIPYGAWH